MKQRLLSFVSRPPIREPGAQWLCQSCLAKSSKRSISSTAPTFQPTAISSDARSANVSSPTQAADPDLVDRFADLREIKLPHRLPPQLLVHVDPIALNDQERREREHLYRWAMAGHVDADFQPKQETVRQIKGVVVSAGKMNRTVKVRVPGQRFEKHVKKYYATYTNHLTHDPNNSLREGDVVILHRLHVSKSVKHIVASIAVPFGTPLHERAPIPTPEDRLRDYKEKRIKRLDFRMLRVQAAAGNHKAQSELSGRKQEPGRKLTESTIQQAMNYKTYWMQRHRQKRAPRLRRSVTRSKASRKISGYEDLGNDVASLDSHATITSKEETKHHPDKVASGKEADPTGKGQMHTSAEK